MIHQIIQQVIRPDILAQSSYHVPDASNMVKLDAMENPYDLPPAIKTELGAHLARVALNRYPVPTCHALKQKICQQFGVPAGFDVVLGNGSDELISMLSVACAKPNAKVMSPVPSFVMYQVYAQHAGMQFIGVPLQADFTLDMPAMLAAIQQHHPAILYLANPNNPTGNWIAEPQVIQLIEAMTGIGLVVVDEAYQVFAPGTIMPRLPEFPHLIVMRTVSKIGMAGLRLGYMSAHSELLMEFEKVRPPYNINVLSAAAAEFLLDHTSLFLSQAETIVAQRSVLVSALQKHDNVRVFPSAANFVLCRVADAEQVFNRLLAHKILVKQVSKMHPLLNNCLRVTVGTPEENRLVIGVLDEILKH